MSKLSTQVESFRFPDIVTQWARERVEHDDVVARALARGIVRDGLCFQEADARWIRGEDAVFRGYPWIGYRATAESKMLILRSETLTHLLAIVERAEAPDLSRLKDLFISRDAFAGWIDATRQTRPAFWFAELKSGRNI